MRPLPFNQDFAPNLHLKEGRKVWLNKTWKEIACMKLDLVAVDIAIGVIAERVGSLHTDV